MRSSDTIGVQILQSLSKQPANSLFQLARTLRTGFTTIRSNCLALERFGFVRIQPVSKDQSPSRRAAFRVFVTEEGRRFLRMVKRNTK